MAVQTLELTHDTGTVLECSTSGTVFGFRFEASVDAVEQFLQYLTSRHLDARDLDTEGSLRSEWEAFKALYVCAECGTGDLDMADLTLCNMCGQFHCGTHEGEEWTDGDKKYGHKC